MKYESNKKEIKSKFLKIDMERFILKYKNKIDAWTRNLIKLNFLNNS